MNEFDIYVIDKAGMISTIKRKMQSNKPNKNNKHNKPKGGAESVFIKLDPKVGLKGFKTKKEARFSMRRQIRAARYGFGPEVMSREIFEVLMPVGGTYLSTTRDWLMMSRRPSYRNKHRRLFAYKTEVADKLFNGNLVGEMRQKLNDLEEIMEQHSFSIEDLHYKNIGMIEDKMVCIDFGILSS